MKLKRAIEILDRHFVLNHNVPLAELIEASKLGIEAMKRVQKRRVPNPVYNFDLLPGETPEEE